MRTCHAGSLTWRVGLKIKKEGKSKQATCHAESITWRAGLSQKGEFVTDARMPRRGTHMPRRLDEQMVDSLQMHACHAGAHTCHAALPAVKPVRFAVSGSVLNRSGSLKITKSPSFSFSLHEHNNTTLHLLYSLKP
ncbi:hypothetical protein A2U01_0029583 [Trifolium medium]|uniref:Uncharacterized protein n=1 Tax=Trifolium medium TaxID=97028 RepID=A0A392PB45_9FABA|nr:hypothetical protein [Trifolium medium]